MSTKRCSRVWQAEAIADGRLHHPEVTAFERHAASCADCTREVHELARLHLLSSQLPVLRASELDRRRQRGELLRKANDAILSAPRPRARLVATAVVGTILVTTASAFGLRAAWQELTSRDESSVQPPTPSSTTHPRPRGKPVPLQPEPAPVEDAVVVPPAPAPSPSVRRKRIAPTEAKLAEAEPPAAGRAFAHAMAAFTAGDYARAQTLFAAFEREHGADDRVEDALFLRAIACSRRGDVAASRAAAKEYLKRYPNGLRTREAEQLAR